MRLLLLIVTALALVGCGGSGGGGGGGGGGTTVTLSGRVIWIETGSGPDPVATVQSGTKSTTTDIFDGYFEFSPPSGVTSATVTYVPPSGGPIVRTFTFPSAVGSVDLGDLYIGPQVVTLKGKVEDASTNLPVSGASVSIAGRQATTLANGTFSIANVAYSNANPAVFLGLEGVVKATGYFARQFNPPTLATGGVVQIGTVSLTPIGSVDPPPPPFDVQGAITPLNLGANATVEALQGASVIRRTTADSAGRYTLWLPVGTYTIKATSGANSGQATVTVTSTNVIKTVNVSI